MRFYLLIAAAVLFFACSKNEFQVSSVEQLYNALKSPSQEKIIHLLPGKYQLTPRAIIDSSCANCQDPEEKVNATAGLILTGKKIFLNGPDDQSAEIITNSGYGLYFLNCDSGQVKNLVLSGGQRDTSSKASDAAIVVKSSSVRIENNLIKNNIGDSALVTSKIVGIMGITGRENSKLHIVNNRIIRNSWDGIALYRGAQAYIKNNIIHGVDKAPASKAAGGRGVAIGITWDAKAVVSNNHIKNYWKGIGVFVNGKARIENNIIEDLLTWGIAYWAADQGSPFMQAGFNIVYNTGACGVNLAARESAIEGGYFKDNIVVSTAQNRKYDSPDYYGYQCALSVFDTPTDFEISANIFFDNRRANDSLPDYDIDETQFREVLNNLFGVNSNFNNPYLKESYFYKEFLKN